MGLNIKYSHHELLKTIDLVGTMSFDVFCVKMSVQGCRL